MKKLISLLLVCLMLASVCAVAEYTCIPDTSLKLDLGDMFEYELDWEDIENDAVMIFGDEDETVECYVFVYEMEGYTLADIEEEFSEEEGILAMGYTSINGVDALYMVLDDDGENYVVYFILDGDNVVEINFWYEDEDAAQLTGVVMATITR